MHFKIWVFVIKMYSVSVHFIKRYKFLDVNVNYGDFICISAYTKTISIFKFLSPLLHIVYVSLAVFHETAFHIDIAHKISWNSDDLDMSMCIFYDYF